MYIQIFYVILIPILKGDGIIDSQENIRNLIEGSDSKIFKEVLNNILSLYIQEIQYNKDIELNNISGYEFKLVKANVKLDTNENVDMYFKMVKKTKIKESIYCYWGAIYEEETSMAQQSEKMEIFKEKVSISELVNKKFEKRMFLCIENNKRQILEKGTEVNFIEIIDYINQFKNEKNKYNELLKYFEEKNDEVLLIGIKMKI